MKQEKTNETTPVVARSRRGSPVLVCKKCLKRYVGGREIKKRLKSELKHRSNGFEKPSRVVLTGCFGICPKNAVTVASGTTLRNGQYVLVSAGKSVDQSIEILMRP